MWFQVLSHTFGGNCVVFECRSQLISFAHAASLTELAADTRSSETRYEGSMSKQLQLDTKINAQLPKQSPFFAKN
jgi:hypothetical protein